MDHAARRDRVRAALDSGGIGAATMLVTDPVNVRYLSGFTGSNGQVLVASEPAGDRLVTDDRYGGRAASEAPGLSVVASRDPVGVALDRMRDADAATDAEGTIGDGTRGSARILAVEADHLTWAAGHELQGRARDVGIAVRATTDLVAGLRAVKDDAEVARLARACELTQQALTWLFDDVVAEGRTERELARALERRFVDLGADGVAFPSIVAAGPNSAVPHHDPGDRALREGDLLTVDCGALVDGYHADHTRTVAIGSVSDELAHVHAVVEAAQRAGREAAVAGATAGDVDGAARGVVEAAGYGHRFVHGTGHGVGLRIHEAPAVASGSAATLVPGTALTVEPGVYLPGTGGVRIEDTIVVTADGPARSLTDTPRELRVL